MFIHRRKLVHTVIEADVGKGSIQGISGHLTCFSPLGRVQACDVGKRIYLLGGVYQVENDAQLKARTAAE